VSLPKPRIDTLVHRNGRPREVWRRHHRAVSPAGICLDDGARLLESRAKRYVRRYAVATEQEHSAIATRGQCERAGVERFEACLGRLRKEESAGRENVVRIRRGRRRSGGEDAVGFDAREGAQLAQKAAAVRGDSPEDEVRRSGPL